MIDNDLSLLARAVEAGQAGRNVIATPVDLARDLELALDGPLDLVTTSALLDLVSGGWLERLALEAAARRLPVYAALTFDGRVEFDPSDPGDAEVVAAVNAHQRRDKGFGPALGPAAPQAAIENFGRVGYEISSRSSRLDLRAAGSRHSKRNPGRFRYGGPRNGAGADRHCGLVGAPQRLHRRWTFVDLRRSRRPVRLADRNPLSRKIAVEQNFVLELMHMDRRPHRLVGAFDRRQ